MPFSISDFVDVGILSDAVGIAVRQRKTPWGSYGSREVEHSSERRHCTLKRPFVSREDAERHRHDMVDMGLAHGALRVYQCDVDPSHFHVGHLRAHDDAAR